MSKGSSSRRFALFASAAVALLVLWIGGVLWQRYSMRRANAGTVRGVARSTAWIRLKWQPQGGTCYYVVERATAVFLVPMIFDDVSPALTTLSFDDDRVSAGTTYYYKVFVERPGIPVSDTEIGAVVVTTPGHDDPLRALQPGEDN